MNDPVYRNANIVGNKNRPLIFETSGKIAVKVNDRYFNLNFKDGSLFTSGTGESESTAEQQIIIVNTNNEAIHMTYPGDDKIIISLEGSIYVCANGKKIELKSDSESVNNAIDGDFTVNGRVIINPKNGEAPIITNSKILIKNLNSNYLNGFTSDDFAKKDVDEHISGKWTFEESVKCTKTIRNGTTNSSGDTVLDFENSILYIDDIVIRNGLTVYEFVSHQATATNGEIWVSDSAKVIKIINAIVDADFGSYEGFNNTDEIRTKYSGVVYNIQIEPSDFHANPFLVNDIIRCKKTERSNSSETKSYSYNGVVLAAWGTSVIVAFDKVPVILNYYDILVKTGNTVDGDRCGALYITSNDLKSPYIDIVDNVDYDYTEGSQTYNTNTNIKVRLGRLDGLASDDIFGDMSGFGVFMQGNTNTEEAFGSTDLEKIKNYAHTSNPGVYLKNLGIQSSLPGFSGYLLNSDGTGYLSDGNIYWNRDGSGGIANDSIQWDKDGNLLGSGFLTTDTMWEELRTTEYDILKVIDLVHIPIIPTTKITGIPNWSLSATKPSYTWSEILSKPLIDVELSYAGTANEIPSGIYGGKLYGASGFPYSYYSFLSFGYDIYKTQLNGYNGNLKFRSGSESGHGEWREIYHSGNNSLIQAIKVNESTSADVLKSTGFSSHDGFSYYVTSGIFEGSIDDWAGYLISNRGNGQTDYSQMLRMPIFNNRLQYQRKENGVNKGWVDIALLTDFSNYVPITGGTYTGYVTFAAGAGKSSDMRFKNNIENLDSCKSLDIILNSPAFKYNWKSQNSKQLGTSAQYYMQHIPEIVNEKNGELSLEYSALTVVLISALQEIYKKYRNLETILYKLNNT